ncbi:uncharacterized protein LOC131928399 [Physella acuta]|uniref:uncharacterized protein LOC131928399 n=1 Tax=Physella acuta TaxID=109671 RepID=UPI0027DD2997|nr:uncharacterized protein LOC131928399 [Physella acuta]
MAVYCNATTGEELMVFCPQIITFSKYGNYEVTRIDDKTVSFKCLRNFHYVSGDQIRQCLPNKTWSGMDYVCHVDRYMERYLLSSIIVLSSVLFSLIFFGVDFGFFVTRRTKSRRESYRRFCQQIQRIATQRCNMATNFERLQQGSPFTSTTRVTGTFFPVSSPMSRSYEQISSEDNEYNSYGLNYISSLLSFTSTNKSLNSISSGASDSTDASKGHQHPGNHKYKEEEFIGIGRPRSGAITKLNKDKRMSNKTHTRVRNENYWKLPPMMRMHAIDKSDTHDLAPKWTQKGYNKSQRPSQEPKDK